MRTNKIEMIEEKKTKMWKDVTHAHTKIIFDSNWKRKKKKCFLGG